MPRLPPNLAFALALAAMLLGGCAGSWPAPAADHAAFADAAARVYRNRIESAPPERAFLRIEDSPVQSGQWQQRRSVGPSARGPWTPQIVQTLRRDGEAHIVLVEETNFDEQVELVYDPPLVIALVGGRPGDAPFQQTTFMRVHPLGNRAATKARGAAAQQITHEPAAPDDVPAIAAPVLKRTLRFTASLAPAEVTNTTTQWLDAAGELVAEVRVERTRVLGLPSRNNRESWVLAPASP